jgi:DNA replication protein DnaC
MNFDEHPFYQRAKKQGLYGVMRHFPEIKDEAWLPKILEWEERARIERGLDRRIKLTQVGRFKPMSLFDWSLSPELDKSEVDRLFTFDFMEDCNNIVLIGRNGNGKTMLAQNLVHEAATLGHRTLFVDAARMLADLGKRPTTSALERRIKHYSQPKLLAIDEVGFFSFSLQASDLFFQIIKERYERGSTIITTNMRLSDWHELFPNKALAGAIIDRLVHHSQTFVVDHDSFRALEAEKDIADRKLEKSTQAKTKSGKGSRKE